MNEAMTVARTRSFLYSLTRFLGDYQAVKNGRIGKRLARRAAGRVTGRVPVRCGPDVVRSKCGAQITGLPLSVLSMTLATYRQDERSAHQAASPVASCRGAQR